MKRLIAILLLCTGSLCAQNQLVGNLKVTGTATFSSRTATRIPFFTTDGLMTDSASLVYNSTFNAIQGPNWHGGIVETAYGGTEVSSTTYGTLLIGGGTGHWGKLAGNNTTTPMILMQTGTGSHPSVTNWYGTIIDAATTTSVDYINRELVDSSAFTTVNWDSCTLSGAGSVSINWATYELDDSSSRVSANWEDRTLIDSGGNPRVNWEAQILYGAWIVSAGFTPSSTNGIIGTTTNNDANAGSWGEYVSALVAVGSPVALATGTAANVTSISLTAGDWDVSGNINLSASGATLTATSGGITITSATVPTDGSEVYSGQQSTTATFVNSVTLPRKRLSLSSTTTVYLVAQCTFSAGSIGAFGSITARRVR